MKASHSSPSSSDSSSASPGSARSSGSSSSSSGPSSSSSGSDNSSTNSSSSNVTAFLSKLWRLVNDYSNNDLICWSQSGCSFVILNQIQFAKDLLPLYFKHSNMASFIRQLNMYGFRKIPIVGSNGGTDQRTDIAQFYHVNFMRGHEQRLASIKRKNNSSKTHNLVVNGTFCEEVRSILNDVRSIRDGQNSSESILGAIQVDSKSLWRDVAILRSQHHEQRRVIEKLIQFLLSLIQNRNSMVSKKRKVRLMIDAAETNGSNSSNSSSPGSNSLPGNLMDGLAVGPPPPPPLPPPTSGSSSGVSTGAGELGSDSAAARATSISPQAIMRPTRSSPASSVATEVLGSPGFGAQFAPANMSPNGAAHQTATNEPLGRPMEATPTGGQALEVGVFRGGNAVQHQQLPHYSYLTMTNGNGHGQSDTRGSLAAYGGHQALMGNAGSSLGQQEQQHQSAISGGSGASSTGGVALGPVQVVNSGGPLGRAGHEASNGYQQLSLHQPQRQQQQQAGRNEDERAGNNNNNHDSNRPRICHVTQWTANSIYHNMAEEGVPPVAVLAGVFDDLRCLGPAESGRAGSVANGTSPSNNHQHQQHHHQHQNNNLHQQQQPQSQQQQQQQQPHQQQHQHPQQQQQQHHLFYS